MTRTTTKLLPLASFLLLAACGGAMDSNPPSAAAPADATLPKPSAPPRGRSVATVYVVHGINGKDLALPEALPVDVQVGDTCALTDFQFRNIAGPISLPAGPTT